jgi:hypothetical protein
MEIHIRPSANVGFLQWGHGSRRAYTIRFVLYVCVRCWLAFVFGNRVSSVGLNDGLQRILLPFLYLLLLDIGFEIGDGAAIRTEKVGPSVAI